jgi:hypothetical protein
VTGFVPLLDQPRSHTEYEKLAYRLGDAAGEHPMVAYFEDRVSDLWLTKFIESLPSMEPPLSWSKADNPKKNNLEWHCVQHQKIAWLERAANEDSEADVFTWIDCGIFSQPGITVEVIRNFLHSIRKHDLALPGCWPPNLDPIDEYPNWRFLGSLIIVPREEMRRLCECFYAMTRLYIRLQKKVSFEINSLARIEPLLKKGNLRWYLANHDASQFVNYSK